MHSFTGTPPSHTCRVNRISHEAFLKTTGRARTVPGLLNFQGTLFGAVILLLVGFAGEVCGQTNGFSIPTNHPRLWFNGPGLTQARTYYSTHPFTPHSDAPMENALRYLMTGEAAYARTAIDWMMGITFDPVAAVGDQARWYGEYVFTVFDWCHAEMTQTERDTIISRWNYYNDVMNHKTWGGLHMPGNNYFQGFMRNSLEWGIVTFHENSEAQAFLNHGLNERWSGSLVPYFKTTGKGGVPEEGSQYGRYLMTYQAIPFQSIELMGRRILDESGFYKEAVYYLIYSSMPGPQTGYVQSQPAFHQLFTFSDDEMSPFSPAAQSYYGDCMLLAAGKWKNEAAGQYARRWLQLVNPPASYQCLAVDSPGTARDFASLPLDYYASGMRQFYVKNSWAASAASVNLQLGFQGSHGHLDFGTFQIRRGGSWLSKESTDYGNNHAGFGGSGTAGPAHTLNHNGIVFTGRGWTLGAAGGYQDGAPLPLRLESRDAYAYAAVDLGKAYQARTSNYTNGDGSPRDDNPFAKSLVREFIFIRALETLVVFDRIEAESDSRWGALLPASQVTKTFLLHSRYPPVIQDGNHVLCTNGTQALSVTTLLPAHPRYAAVNDGNYAGSNQPDYPEWYQYRLEVNDSGTAQSYFLHVLQARDLSGTNVTTSLVEDASCFYLNLSHPALGKAAVVFVKGMMSTGGQFGYAAAGQPVLNGLSATIQPLRFTDSGPAWWKPVGTVIQVGSQ